MNSLLQKCFAMLVVLSLVISQTMPVLAQENTPEPPTDVPTPIETETPTPEPTISETTTPTVTNDATATPVVTDSPETIPTTPLIEIKLSATPETIKPDGKITLHWEVTGIEKTNANLILQLNMPSGFEPTKENVGEFDSKNKIINIPLSELKGTIHLQAIDQITEDAVFIISLYDEKQVLIGTNQVIVPLREKFEVDKNGGEVTARDGELKVKFSSEVLKNEDIEVEIGSPADNTIRSLSGKPFEITAKTKKDGIELTQFDEEIEFSIDLNAYGIPVEKNDNIFLYWFNPETQEWSGISSWVDDETNILYGQVNHFSIFDIGANNWEASKKPSINSFQVSTFTGAATYSLPIELPAGPGGFQPSLSLNYNSQIIDQSTTWSQVGWVGAGWTLDTGFVEVNLKNDYEPNNDSYSLNFNGVSTEIINTSTGWRLANENFMKVNYDGNKWIIWDKEGTIYEFEQKTIMKFSPLCDYLLSAPNRWSLTKIKNKFGQEINYTYTTETKPIKYMIWSAPHNECRNYGQATTDTATYPDTVTYAGGKVRVRFVLEGRSDYALDYLTDEIHHSFERSRLDQIIIEQDLDANGSFESILRKYDLTYSTTTNKVWPNVVFSGGASFSSLASVTEYGVGGTNPLPAITFTYGDSMHLTEANNGYGGIVIFNYEPWAYPTPSESYKKEWNYNGGSGYLVPAGATYQLPNSTGIPLKPGGVYVLVTLIRTGDSGYLRLYDGTSYQTTSLVSGTASTVFFLPKTASTSEGQFYNPNGWNARLYYSYFAALTTIYRVTSKTIIDGNSNSQDLTYSYTYEGPTVNTASSISVMNSLNTLVSVEPYAEKYSQFLGHSKVTITEPDNITKTIIEYYQTEELKGREKKTILQVNGTNRNQSVPAYTIVNLPGLIYGTRGIPRYWVKLDAVENYIYNNSGGEVGRTKTVYTYESTYGNMLTQTEQSWNGIAWATYRSTTNYYWFNNSATRYLVSLIGKTKVFDAGNNLLVETLYLYDNNTGDHAVAPVDGKLTSVRTLIDNTNGAYNQITYGYDFWGNQTTQTTWTGYSAWNANPSTGVQTTTTDYDTVFHTYPIKVTNPLGQFIEINYDYTKGVPNWLKDLNGNITTATYDAHGRITGIKRPDDSSDTLTMTYVDNYPFTTTITLNPTNYAVTRKYDGMGREIQVISGGIISDIVYQSSTVTKQSVPYTGTSPNLFTTTTVNPSANSTTITAPDTTFATTAVNGLTTTVTDAKGYLTTSTSDVWGRVTQVTPPTGHVVAYTYYPTDALWTVTRGGATTTLTYDNAGRKKTMTDPDMGYWQYTYDALGNLKTQTDARGCLLTMHYDPLNRLTNKNSSGSCGTQVSTSYTYDQNANGIGYRTSMTDASGSTSWLYDSRGRMTKETKVISGQSFVTDYGYNSADMLTWMKYPDNEIVNYTYDTKMMLDTVYSTLGTYVQDTTYDSAGRIDNRILGNGLTQDFTYYNWDEQVSSIGQGGRLKTLVTGSLQNLTYTYDKAGNIVNLNNSIASETSTYGYDQLHRLTSWNLNGTTENYSYDSAGKLDVKAGVDLNYNDTSHKHATTHIGSTQKYWYDANGNQITRIVGSDTFNLLYDAENRLIEVKKNSTTIATFVYDGDGKRVKATENGVTTLFVGAHYEVKGSEITKYYFAGASRIAMRKYTVPVSMSVEYFLSDHLGSTSITTDNAGAKISEMRYKPWGEVRYSWTATQTTTPAYTLPKFTFTGQYSYMDDPSTSGVTEGFGLMFYNARWYDSSLGRFAQADTMIPLQQGVQAWDRYAYVNNSPINYTDPTGYAYCDYLNSGNAEDCNGGQWQNSTSKGFAKGYIKSFLKDRYDWDVASDFSEDELKTMRQTAYDIEAYANNLTGGNGLNWMLQYLGNINVVHNDNTTQDSYTLPIPFIGATIFLGQGWLTTGNWDPNQLLAHELGHVLDIRTAMNASVQLYEDMGGSGFSWPFREPTDILPWRQNVNDGYGSTGINDYFAEAFSWTIYDKTNAPSGVPALIDAMIIDQVSFYEN